jgi:hypothetical protein
MPEQDGRPDLIQVNPPAVLGSQGEHVIDPAVNAITQRYRVRCRDHLAQGDITKDGRIGVLQLRAKESQQALRVIADFLDVIAERSYQGRKVILGVTVSLDIGFHHAVCPRQPGGINGGKAAQGRNASDPPPQLGLRGARKRMRSATRTANNTEISYFKIISNILNIIGRISNPPARQPIGVGITRPAVADEADSAPVQKDPTRARPGEAARSAVHQEDGRAIGVAKTLNRDHAAVASLNLLHEAAPPAAFASTPHNSTSDAKTGRAEGDLTRTLSAPSERRAYIRKYTYQADR